MCDANDDGATVVWSKQDESRSRLKERKPSVRNPEVRRGEKRTYRLQVDGIAMDLMAEIQSAK